MSSLASVLVPSFGPPDRTPRRPGGYPSRGFDHLHPARQLPAICVWIVSVLGQQGANCKALWIKAGHLPFSEISVVCVHACLSHVCPCVSEPWCKAVKCGLCVVYCAFLADTSQHALPSVCPSLTRTQHTQPLTSSPTGRQRTQLMLSDYFEVPLFKKKATKGQGQLFPFELPSVMFPLYKPMRCSLISCLVKALRGIVMCLPVFVCVLCVCVYV